MQRNWITHKYTFTSAIFRFHIFKGITGIGMETLFTINRFGEVFMRSAVAATSCKEKLWK